MTASADGVFACPACRVSLASDGDKLECPGCGTTYPSANGIRMLAPAAGAGAHKEQQESYFDLHTEADWELVRPAGAPRFHEWLIREKFSRAIEPIGASLHGATVLVVCGGSGMDAEFLADAGAATITSDLSNATALRAADRARRSHAAFASIVADAEQLPFRDRSVDIVYVHDGLHHLEEPERGLQEMCRVAREAVVISEPARSAITRAAVKCGLAEDVEEAGNVVARLDPSSVAQFLRRQGFDVARCGRYAMLYRHRPGRPMRFLSSPVVFQLAVLAFRAANAIVGRFGNKLVVVGVRR